MPTTSGHGIYYPSSTDSVNLWEHHQLQAESVETALGVYETWNNWALTWDTSGGGGFTSVGGSGQSQGFYSQIGKLVHAEFRVELASGFVADSGTFALALPVAAYAFGGSVIQSTLGTWTARDDSVPYHFSGSLGLWSSACTHVTFDGSWDGTKPRSRIDSNDPITWASGDILSGVLNYRAA